MISNKSNIWKCALIGVQKYKNITSAKLVDQIKSVIQSEANETLPWLKMGHGGTLDESATGVLVVGSGLGCKLLPNFLHGSKKYIVEGQLGVETDTFNETGKVTKELPYDGVTREKLLLSLKEFKGKMWQTPPKYSALKSGGRRFSDLTIEGVDVPVKPRMVHCYSIHLLQFEPPSFKLAISCGSGFYVRSLIRDLGLAVGTCAHVTSLHRSKHGFISEENAVSSPFTYDQLLQNATHLQRTSEFKKMLLKFNSAAARSAKTFEIKNEVWVDPT